MRQFLIAVCFTLMICSTLIPAQEKVAEGKYQAQTASGSGAPQTKTLTQWTLYEKPSGGYRLQSEIENQPEGVRVLQIEELTDHFVPKAIGYELYRNDQKDPYITANCDLSNGVVICSGISGDDRAIPSPPYKPSGPFWMWVEGLFALDMPWLVGGAIDMAHPGQGKAKINALVVSGGSGVMIGDAVNVATLKAIKPPLQDLKVMAPSKPIPWTFKSPEESSVEFVASESMELNGTKVAVTHYSLTNAKTSANVWITDSGLVAKLSQNKYSSYILTGYRQYRKLIPELQVEGITSKDESDDPAAVPH